MGCGAIFLLRAGLAVVGVARDPRPATSPGDMRAQDVPTPALDRDTRADTEHLSVRVVDVRPQPAVRVTEDQDVTGDHRGKRRGRGDLRCYEGVDPGSKEPA